MNDDMSKKTLMKTIFLAVVLVTFAACTQDEMPDNGNTLPEGKYPLEIASVTMDVTHSQQPWNADAPQTRVSENTDGMSSKWDGRETIHVKLGNQETTYKVTDANGSLNLTGEQLYWTKRTDNVTAWYTSSETDGTINLADQSGKLAYVLQATVENASCDNSVTLNFSHQLAKVRVVLTGDKASEVKNVSIKGYTVCTHTDGGNVSGKSEGEIKMYSVGNNTFEANVVPGKEMAEFNVNGGEWITLSTKVNPEKGKCHKITIDVKPAGPSVITGGETIDKPGDYIMVGNITSSVTLNAEGINLTLDNVQAKTNDAPLIIGNNAQVTLNISGTANSLTSTNGNGIEIKEGASLTITGNGKNSSKLVVKASDNTNPNMELRAGIGPSTGNVSIKTININNVHLVVSGGRTGNNGNGPAAIGLCSVNGTYNQSCEGISITDSKIEATSYGGACIGTGSVSNDIYTGGTYNLGLIDIRNSEITATANGGAWSDCGSCIGFGYIGADASGVIKGITITNTTLNLTVMNSSAYKVGRGNKINNASYNITDGIIFNGQNKGSEGWNP